MNSHAWTQLVVFLLVLAVIAWPMGQWLAAVADGRLPGWLAPIRRIENGLYKLADVDAGTSTGWKPTRSACSRSTCLVSSRCMRCSGCKACCR